MIKNLLSLVVVRKFASLSSKLLLTKEERGGKYQPIRQQGNKSVKHEATKQQMAGGN
jgi:hypothetical protein